MIGLRNNMSKVTPTVLAVGEVKNLDEAQAQANIIHTGFIAQEFGKLTGNPNATEIDYNQVLAVLWLKVQELESRIKVLEAKK